MLTLSTPKVDNGNMLQQIYNSDPAMTTLAFVLLALCVPCGAGIFLDPRRVHNAPVWLKPAKFAVSIPIYLISMAFMRGHLSIWPEWVAVASGATTWMLLLEWVLIVVQAARGTGSHFNVGKPLDAAILSAMAAGIAIVWVASVFFAVALFRQPFLDPVLGTALRLGMVLTVLGSASGRAMIGPTPVQLEEARITGRLALAGAHTVGAPDGGPGLPVTNWSTQHGDLRVPHFLGLHGMQFLLLVGWLAGRVFAPAIAVLLLEASAGVYFLLFLYLYRQARSGIPVWRR